MTLAAEARPLARRIALLIESDGPGGAESVVHGLANGLKERGHTVLPVIFSPGQGWLSGRLKRDGFSVHQPRLAYSIDPRFAWQLARWARREKVDVFHAHEWTMGFYSGVAGLIAHRPHLITMHGGTGFADASRRRHALRWSAKRAAFTIGVSESTCDHLAQALGLDRADVTLVPNGVSLPTGDRIRARASLGIADDESLILAVGNLYPVKGHRVLVDAAAAMAARVDLPRWKIAIAGRGDEEAPLRERIRECALESRIQLLGLRDDIPDLLAAADLWVMPSLSEGLPMALLEAMLASLPVVASGVGGIPALLSVNDSGTLVKPDEPVALANALASKLLAPADARAMGERASIVAESGYGRSTMVERYAALYERALDPDGA